jgi:hypothetical protein
MSTETAANPFRDPTDRRAAAPIAITRNEDPDRCAIRLLWRTSSGNEPIHTNGSRQRAEDAGLSAHGNQALSLGPELNA